jgi:hypothetical protein
VIELLTGGELFDRIVALGSYSEKEASTVMKSLTEAIQHLHKIGVVHRDLKPEVSRPGIALTTPRSPEPHLRVDQGRFRRENHRFWPG